MTPLTRLLREVARRNLFQTLGIFLGAGWGVLQVADPELKERAERAGARAEALTSG